jgi:hypothetical protein
VHLVGLLYRTRPTPRRWTVVQGINRRPAPSPSREVAGGSDVGSQAAEERGPYFAGALFVVVSGGSQNFRK